jgi:TonB-linked SusC/RagA family outer membrane protein
MLLCVFSLSVDLHAQNLNIKGKVMDQDGNVLPGAAVRVQGSSIGVVANDDGDYALSNVPKGSILEFIIVGFVTQEIKVTGDKTVINAILLEEAESLEDVTIVAFGRQKKESVIASVESVRVSDLKIASSNLTTAFAGKIPGLISYQTSGEPGADNAKFFIRGVTTFGYKSDPLILIDGFEASSNDLARLQPDDIESFSILKDASATVLYGARGANGIITVTTKGGQEGNAKVSARVDVNVATPTKMLELLDGVEYMRLYNQARLSRQPDEGTWYSEQKIQATAQGQNPMIYPNINWYDALFKNSTVNTKANINVSGGGKVATYYVAGGFDHETGLLKVDKLNNFNNNIDIKRFHLRSNFTIKLTSTTTLDTRIQGRFETYSGPFRSATDIYNMVMDANPVDFPPVYAADPAHQFVTHTLFGSAFTDAGGIKTNPYAEMVRGYDQRDSNTITAQATLMQDLGFLTEGLQFQAKASANTNSSHSGIRSYSPFYYALETYDPITGDYSLYNLNPDNPNANLGDVNPYRDASTRFYFEGRLNWDRKFGKHSVGLMTVAMAEENILGNGLSTSIYETLPERNVGNSGRATYDYDSRYFFEFSYGYNGSEKFTGKMQFGFFPSFGAGWIVSNERFWEPLKNAVSLLKLKATYGKVGNDAIAELKNRFFFLSDIRSGGGNYWWGSTFSNSYRGYTVVSYANPGMTWEESTKYNLGLELSFLKNEALKFQIDFFKDIRDKIYERRETLPTTSGFELGIWGNSGKASSKGIDASIDLQHSFNPDFWISGRANFTVARNEVLAKDEPNYTDEYRKEVGQSTEQGRGLIAERLFVDDLEIEQSPSQKAYGEYQAGDIKYLDVNGDGEITDADRVPIGYPTSPEIQYGFGMSLGYKRFDLSFFFQGNARVSFYISPGAMSPFVDRHNAPAVVARGAWTEMNPDVHAFWPRLSTREIKNNIQQSTWWLRDGSFLRLKTLEAGYTLPGIQRIHMQSSRIYLSVENLFHLSSFKLWDPEVGGNGLGYPLNRRFNIGLQLSF